MKATVFIFIALALLCESSVFADPKAKRSAPKAIPHPANVLISATIKMTDFMWDRIARDAYSQPAGIRHPELKVSFPDILPKGKSRRYVRKELGIYEDPQAPIAHAFFCARYSGIPGGEHTEVCADDLRDVFGSDAITDVKEIPWEEVQRQGQANEIRAIQDALKKSQGNTAEAAERLKMSGIDITEQELLKKIGEYHISTSSR